MHSGQSEHPRPEPVSRTAPPVPMMIVSLMNDNHAKTVNARPQDEERGGTPCVVEVAGIIVSGISPPDRTRRGGHGPSVRRNL
ncbi:hypothetical protein GCM10009587_12340 [Microbacterium maritypicum]